MTIGNRLNLKGTGTAYANGALTKYRLVANDVVNSVGAPQVKPSATAQSATIASVDTIVGVSKDAYASGALAEYYNLPGSLLLVEYGGTIAAGDLLVTDGSARVITAPALTAGQYAFIVGRAQEAGTVGQVRTILFFPELVGKN